MVILPLHFFKICTVSKSYSLKSFKVNELPPNSNRCIKCLDYECVLLCYARVPV
jgi:hypothetical protein